MALADYTFVDQSGAGAAPAITAVTPLQGVYSLDIVQNASPAIGKWLLAHTVSPAKDCVDVKVLFQQRGAAWFGYGLFVQLQGAIALASSAYTACIPTGTAGAPGVIVINKTTLSNAIQDTGGLGTSAITNPTANTVVAMGLRAERNATTGNVLVTVSYDAGPISIPTALPYTFPGLVPLLTYVDVGSPYITGTFGIIGTTGLTAGLSMLADALTVDTD